jgi:Holliday junction resolvasome RuvABC DNA-binding subunit
MGLIKRLHTTDFTTRSKINKKTAMALLKQLKDKLFYLFYEKEVAVKHLFYAFLNY